MNKYQCNKIIVKQKNLRAHRLNIYHKAIHKHPKKVYKLFVNYPNFNADKPEDWSFEFYIKLINILGRLKFGVKKKSKCVIM